MVVIKCLVAVTYVCAMAIESIQHHWSNMRIFFRYSTSSD